MTTTDTTPDVASALPNGAVVVDAPATGGTRRDTLRAINELTKPRITRLVTITSAVGFVMGAVGRSTWLTWDLLIAAVGALAGTALSAAGASALNMWMERDRDALMPRTCGRPLPRARVTPRTAFMAGTLLCVAGVGTLLATAGIAAATVSFATIILYVLLYTPLKPVTTVSTIIGAVPGALPPLIGWCAATANGPELPWAPLMQAGGWSLFLLMFVWQIPHFLAIAWMYRDDYAKGGYRMLPLLDPTGVRTSKTILLWSAALLPATLSPALAMPGRLGAAYAVFAVASGALYFYLAVRFNAEPNRDNARRVFLASIMHLPLLLMAMVVDAMINARL